MSRGARSRPWSAAFLCRRGRDRLRSRPRKFPYRYEAATGRASGRKRFPESRPWRKPTLLEDSPKLRMMIDLRIPGVFRALRTLSLAGRRASGGRILSAREFPDPERVFAEQQLPVFRRIEIERGIHELEFLIHRQFPARARVSSAPHQLFAAEFFVNRLEERIRVAIWKFLGQR